MGHTFVYVIVLCTKMDYKSIKCKHLGTLTGELLVFGGVYSNLQALEKLIAIASVQNISPENIICTGDIVGYCAQPEEVVETIKRWGIHCIVGNVELQLRNGEESCGCNFRKGSRCDDLSQLWYPYAQTKLSAQSLDWMQLLPEYLRFRYANKEFLVVHGSYHHVSEYIFRSTPWSVKAINFSNSQSDVILAGHCGLPFHDSQADKLWINPGVIGMPANDGTPRVWYMTLTEHADQSLQFQHHAYEYDCATTSQLMQKNQLPAAYAHTLLTGVWDNCEILPVKEKGLQGVAIHF